MNSSRHNNAAKGNKEMWKRAHILIPAYGRSYLTAEDAVRDWNDGKDFKILGGPYASVRDAHTMRSDGYEELHICINMHNVAACLHNMEYAVIPLTDNIAVI